MLAEQRDTIEPPGEHRHPSLSSIFIVCKDLDESLRFYRGLGFPLLEKKSRSYLLGVGNTLELHLHEALTEREQSDYGVESSAGSRGMVLSYEVEDLETLWKQLPAERLLRKPTLTPWGHRILMACDPDQNLIELRERQR